MPRCRILVVQDPPVNASSVPGILGMNIIRRCYRERFGVYGLSFFDSPFALQALGPVLVALQKCHQSTTQALGNPTGPVRVQGKQAVRIRGGVMKLVASTCSEQSSQSVLYEPPQSGLPAGLLESPCLIQVQCMSLWLMSGQPGFFFTHGQVLAA